MDTNLFRALLENRDLLNKSHREALRSVLNSLWASADIEALLICINSAPEEYRGELVGKDLIRSIIQEPEKSEPFTRYFELLKAVWPASDKETRSVFADKVATFLTEISANDIFDDLDEQAIKTLSLVRPHEISSDSLDRLWVSIQARLSHLMAVSVGLLNYLLSIPALIINDEEAEYVATIMRNPGIFEEESHAVELLGKSDTQNIEVLIKWNATRSVTKTLVERFGKKEDIFNKLSSPMLLSEGLELIDPSNPADLNAFSQIALSRISDQDIDSSNVIGSLKKLIVDAARLHIDTHNEFVFLRMKDLIDIDQQAATSTLIKVLEDVSVRIDEPSETRLLIMILKDPSYSTIIRKDAQRFTSIFDLLKSKVLNQAAIRPSDSLKLIEVLIPYISEPAIDDLIKKLLGIILARLQSRKTLRGYKSIVSSMSRHKSSLKKSRRQVKEISDILSEAGRPKYDADILEVLQLSLLD